MASEFQQQILYLYQGMEHMVGLDRTAGSLGASFCPCKDKNRLIVPLSDPSGYNSSQGLMAVGQKDH